MVSESEIMKFALPSGRPCKVIPSRRRSPGLDEGRHFILQPISEEPPLQDQEQEDLLAEALRFAKGAAKEPGRYRVAINGSAQRKGQMDTRATTHVHIMLPEGNDELPRLVRPDLEK